MPFLAIATSVRLFLLVAAFVCVILAALKKCPAWIPVLLVIVWALLTVLPK